MFGSLFLSARCMISEAKFGARTDAMMYKAAAVAAISC